MNSSLQQSIISTVTSAVVTAVAFIQAKDDNKMVSVQEIVKKSRLVRESLSATPPSDHDATSKVNLGNNSVPKTITKWWNQVDLGYFNSHFDRAHGKGEIVSVRKDVYYRNVVLFVQRL